MSTPELTTTPPPPPISRSLEVVLRETLAAAQDDLRLVIAKALPDTTQNANSHMNVEIEGVSVTVPKLAAANLGGTGSGYPVYCLATTDFVLAVGAVFGTAVPLVVPALTVTPGNLTVTPGTATIQTLSVTGAATVAGRVTAGEFYTGAGGVTCAGLQVNGAAVITGNLNCAVMTASTGIQTSGDCNASGWVQGGGLRTLTDDIRVQGNNQIGFFRKSPISQPRADYSSDPYALAPRLWTALRDLGLIQNV